MPDKSDSRAISDTEAFKRLMILDLTARGVKQKHIAIALGVSEGTLSTMFPKGMLREVRGGRNELSGE